MRESDVGGGFTESASTYQRDGSHHGDSPPSSLLRDHDGTPDEAGEKARDMRETCGEDGSMEILDQTASLLPGHQDQHLPEDENGEQQQRDQQLQAQPQPLQKKAKRHHLICGTMLAAGSLLLILCLLCTSAGSRSASCSVDSDTLSPPHIASITAIYTSACQAFQQ